MRYRSLRARLEEPEELQRAISEGDLDALVMPVSEEELMVFTLNSADRAYRMLLETANEDMVIVDAEFKIARQAADMIGQARSEEALRESNAHLEAELVDIKLLQSISAELLPENNTQELYEKIIDAAMKIMHSDYASMQMLYPERGKGWVN